MLDIKFIRENPEKIKEACKKRQVKVDVDRLLKIDEERRESLKKIEEIRAQKNKATKTIPGLKDRKEKKRIISKMQKLDKKSDKLEEALKKLDEEFEKLICQIPNLCLEEVPVGEDERNNIVLKEVGKKPKFSFKPRDYLEIAENLDLIDMKRAAKVSGTRFGYFKKEVALLEFALIDLALEILTKKGFIPVVPPVMIKPEMAWGMGYLEQYDKEEAYFIPKDNLYLIGTSEQSIGAMHAGEIFKEKELPKRYVGFSTCFRRESGSYGKDTKGIFRVHQFDKVEMFIFCQPDKSREEHKLLLSLEERLMQLLKIPYRVVQLCSGDLARPSAATFDIEVWLPSQNRYRETHSTSNCTDFQARRLNIRYRGEKDKKLDFVHTLNGTAFAIGRTLIAIIENYQQKDGSIKVPKILQKYLGLDLIK
jgi:seryl-tRNA synthetase